MVVRLFNMFLVGSSTVNVNDTMTSFLKTATYRIVTSMLNFHFLCFYIFNALISMFIRLFRMLNMCSSCA